MRPYPKNRGHRVSTEPPARPDFLIIGSGIVGLSIAREVLLRQPGATVVLLEKEHRVGLHASGRNSGVIHAGFYYSPDSLKSRFTRTGNQLLRDFCADHGVKVRDCGKVVVTRTPTEIDALHELFSRGAAAGVELELIDSAALREIEPRAATCGLALWSPTTGVADPNAVVSAIAADVVRLGGHIATGEPALALGHGRIRTPTRSLSTGHVINTAGLHADQVARWFGFCESYIVIPFKGLYWYSTWPTDTMRTHVYPVPDPRNPFLGVHLTVTVDGGCKVGPTAVPALRREDYGRWPGLSAAETPPAVRTLGRFLTSPHHDAKSLIRTELPKYRQRTLVGGAKAIVPSVDPASFRRRGTPGVRAQLMHKRSGQLEMDFVIEGDDRSTHVLNAVSPAWTSSLAFAEHVADVIGLS